MDAAILGLVFGAVVFAIGVWLTRKERQDAIKIDTHVFNRLNLHDEAIAQLYGEVAGLKARERERQ